MRLLHVESLCFEEFFDDEIPPYAILSHRWEGKEVAFHEFEAAKERDGPEFSKIKNFCSFVRQQPYPGVNLEWVWIDTCCIDKKSSAELSEAINSMFQWYKRSMVCYAYLSSVDTGPWGIRVQQFKHSPWFTRGWTLQELIAPRSVFFLDRQWTIIREKSEIAAEISAITGIEKDYLNLSHGRWNSLDQTSIATKMSWVSRRETSRPEDMAYCLLGIFDINMPLLYGEGMKAFMRLQLEIIRKSDDETIFAWPSPNPYFMQQGMLASWPSWFINCGDIRTYVKFPRPPYSMTNKGLEFRVPAYVPSQERMTVVLNCTTTHGGGALLATIELGILGDRKGIRYSKDGAKFVDFTEFEEGDTINTDIIYIPQSGL